MSIRIHDVMERAVVDLDPRDEGRIAMYVCGPTVYGYIHIGNARTLLWFEFMRRYFTYRGYEVTYVTNYTDVDDRIIEKASAEGIPADGVAQKYARAFEEDMSALNVELPDVLCLATEHIDDMVKAIEGLVEKDFAYEADGDVFFAVESFESYGKLSKRSLEEMNARERIEPHPGKRHPLDFALWKKAKEGEPQWESPWGPGRPGWHIECSVMSTKYLGMGFDLHGGGSDLIFPHHENEIAQAEALAGSEPFVRHWLHAGMVQMETAKMSKSLGNVVLAKDVRARYEGEVVRYWALMGSYRTQAIFSEQSLEDAAQSYDRWKTFLSAARHALGDLMPERVELARRPIAAEGFEGPGADFAQRFVAALDDDFNSAEAFAAIHDLVTEANRRVEGVQRGDDEDRERLVALTETFLELTSVLNLRFETAAADPELLAGLIGYLLELREQARADKDFERADGIRAKLADLGVILEDTPAGTRWRTTPSAGGTAAP